jgi:hypothetical protein
VPFFLLKNTFPDLFSAPFHSLPLQCVLLSVLVSVLYPISKCDIFIYFAHINTSFRFIHLT